MKKYGSYKDSGIEWIGEIPSEWDFLKVRHTFFLKGRIGWQGLKADEFIDKGPYLVTGTDFQNGQVNWDTCYHISEERYNEAPEIHVKNGDVLITKDGTVGKMAFIENKPEKVSLNSHLLIVRPLLNSINNKYVYWAFQTSSFDYYKGLSQTGSIMESLSQEKIASFIMPYPSLQEQTAIANYLDDKCSKIDNVIATQEKRVELLRELKQSIITRAVTRGINPDAKMKDSGVEWIGEIPEHWEIKKIKYLKSSEPNAFVDGPFGSNLKSQHFVQNGDVYVIESGMITTGKFIFKNFKTITKEHFATIQRSECKAHDIIIAKIGMNYGMAGELPKLDKPSVVSGNSLKITLDNNKVLNPVFVYLMEVVKKNGGYIGLVQETAQPALSLSGLNNFGLPIAPIEEQEQIIAFIESKTNKIEASITKALRQIELLKEYKQSLITEVVTGKRKVC